ncbi:MAG TPA: flavodoxin family protein [Clostridia bacterium]|nr:flavodoxin family protein [Clostridia bacterium]
MRLLITDIKDMQSNENSELKVITDNGTIRHCIGCFGCWIKTPGRCVIKDGYETTGEILGKCSELILISRCTYGGFSPFVKNVLDRAISYISPHFVLRSGELHHKRRYDNRLSLTAYFYGEDITDAEKETAQSLLKANALNFDAQVTKVLFFKTAEEAREAAI